MRETSFGRKRVPTLSILRVPTLFFVQEMSNSVADVIESL